MTKKATFSSVKIDYTANYDVYDAKTGHLITGGIQGADLMHSYWERGAEAYPSGTEFFDEDFRPITIKPAAVAR